MRLIFRERPVHRYCVLSSAVVVLWCVSVHGRLHPTESLRRPARAQQARLPTLTTVSGEGSPRPSVQRPSHNALTTPPLGRLCRLQSHKANLQHVACVRVRVRPPESNAAQARCLDASHYLKATRCVALMVWCSFFASAPLRRVFLLWCFVVVLAPGSLARSLAGAGPSSSFLPLRCSPPAPSPHSSIPLQSLSHV